MKNIVFDQSIVFDENGYPVLDLRPEPEYREVIFTSIETPIPILADELTGNPFMLNMGQTARYLHEVAVKLIVELRTATVDQFSLDTIEQAWLADIVVNPRLA